MNLVHVTSFLEAMDAGDTGRLGEHLREDVVLASLSVDAPFVGREAAVGVLSVLHRGVDPFETAAVIAGERRAAVMLRIRAGNAEVTGVDDVEVDEAGLIASMSVQWRPLAQVVAIQQELAPLIGVPALEPVAKEPA